MAGIVSFGAYVPQLRLQRSAIAQATVWFNQALAGLAKGERAMANWDEDAVTMAVEAARDCLGERERSAIGRVMLASTSLPFADRQNAGIVKEALNLPDVVSALDVTGSQRAGTSALIAALEAAEAGRSTLCIASERRRTLPGSETEFLSGHAAGALLVGNGEEVAAEFIGSHSTTIDFVDHFRADGQAHDYEWEGRWIRDEGYRKLLPSAIKEALDKLDLTVSDIDHLVIGLPGRGIDKIIARDAGLNPEALPDSLQDTLGFAGSAHPLLLLSSVLKMAAPGATILVVGFGQGCDVLAFRTTGKLSGKEHRLGVNGWLARRQAEDNYIKHLFFGGEINLDSGMRAEIDLRQPSSMLYRERKAILSLVGGRCRETGTVQFPKTAISVARNARMVETQEDYPLAEHRANVITITADRLAYSPSPPSWYGMIEFEGGGRLMADFTDVGDDGLAVGDKVRMMFRLRRTDTRGFKQYFWKAVPDYRTDK